MQRGWSFIETVILLLILVAVYWGVSAPDRTLKSVNIGMTRTEVVAAIGRPPNMEEKELSFCLPGAQWHGDCEKVKKSPAVNYLLWKAGVDSWVVVGFDADGKVCYRGQGDT